MRRTTETTTEEEILVKVGRIGNPVIEVVLNGARTVADALLAADIQTGTGDLLRVAGETVSLTDELDEGDVLVVAGSIKGGFRS